MNKLRKLLITMYLSEHDVPSVQTHIYIVLKNRRF